MKYTLVGILAFCLFFSCSPTYKFNKDKAAFDASKITYSFKSVADMNDSYFEIRENNFFEFYRELFDSVKNTRYPGRFTQHGDTMMLNFYNKKGEELLGNKAVILAGNKKIEFFR